MRATLVITVNDYLARVVALRQARHHLHCRVHAADCGPGYRAHEADADDQCQRHQHQHLIARALQVTQRVHQLLL
jgi:hypothetical protein